MKNSFKTVSIFILLAMLCAINLNAAYYVNPGGNNSNTGTKLNPWKTIGFAIEKANAGDTVYVEYGVYKELIIMSKSGLDSAPIVFCGINNPIIGQESNNVNIWGKHLVIDGFEIRNTASAGVIITGSYIKMQNCNIHHNSEAGIIVNGGTNVTIYGGKIFDNKMGIQLLGDCSNLLIDSVELFSTGKQITAINSWGGGNTKNLTLRKLLVHDHPKYGAELMPSTGKYLYDVTIADCHFYNNGSGEPNTFGNNKFRSANLLLQRVSNGIMERNIFERGLGWGVDIYGSQNVKVHNNLFLNNYDYKSPKYGPGFGLEVNASNGTTVYNNTFYGNETALLISYIGDEEGWPPGAFKVTIRNNIFYKSRTKDYTQDLREYAHLTTIVMNNNLLGVNPLFNDANNDDFRLLPGSLAINSGSAVEVAADYDGLLRPQGSELDMGMFEYSATTEKQYSLKTTVTGQGMITKNQTRLTYKTGTTVSLTATPLSGWFFKEWSGAASGSTNPVSVTINENSSVSATFIREAKEPFLGTPFSLPGTIECEKYDKGGEGISYHDSDSRNEGVQIRYDGIDIGGLESANFYAIAWIATGEWFEYTVNVASEGVYDVDLYTASDNSSGRLGISADGTDFITGVILPKTSGWGSFVKTTKRVTLKSGKQIWRVKVENGGFNIQKIVVKSIPTSISDKEVVQNSPKLLQRISERVYQLSSDEKWKVINLSGKIVAEGNGKIIDLNHLTFGMYLVRYTDTTSKVVLN